jgi:hypothetical protein
VFICRSATGRSARGGRKASANLSNWLGCLSAVVVVVAASAADADADAPIKSVDDDRGITLI